MGFTKLFQKTLRLHEGSSEPVSAEVSPLHQAALHPDAHPDGGLACNDEQLLTDMRSSIKAWLKQMGSKLMQGSIPNLVNTSFPVNMFEPRSYLEKLSDMWVYPDILEAAVDAPTPLERMKLLVTWFVAGLQHANEKWRKPFNPVLGETHQAALPGGVRLYMEQISHHPPLSAWLLEGADGRWRYTGWSQPAVVPVMKWCGIKTAAKGVRRLELADGTVIEFFFPPYAIKGVVYQSRPRAEIIGSARIVDSKNRLEAVLNFGAVKGSRHSIMARSDAVSGEIYQLSPHGRARFTEGVVQRSHSSLELLPREADVECDGFDTPSHSADGRTDSFTSAHSELDVADGQPGSAAGANGLAIAPAANAHMASHSSNVHALNAGGNGHVDHHSSNVHMPQHGNAAHHHILTGNAHVSHHGTAHPLHHGGAKAPQAQSTSPVPYADSASSLDSTRRRDQDSKWPQSTSNGVWGPSPFGTSQATVINQPGLPNGGRQPHATAAPTSVTGAGRAAAAPAAVAAPKHGGAVRQSLTPDVARGGGDRTTGAEVPGMAVARIEGSWLSHLNIDNKRYWTLSEARPTRFCPVQSPLPSDCRFRQDLAALAAGDAQAAQAAKEAMEQLQRRDKKLREEAGVHEGHVH